MSLKDYHCVGDIARHYPRNSINENDYEVVIILEKHTLYTFTVLHSDGTSAKVRLYSLQPINFSGISA